jgi:reverse transcriptase-like protein
MSQLGFKHTQSDAGVFIKTHKNGDKIIAIVYVDDALFASSSKKLALEEKARFMKKWECRDLGEAKEFLGMKIR